MSQLTYFPIFVDGGFKGNLANAPEFGETPKGEAYAKLTVFLKAADPLDIGLWTNRMC